MNKALIGLLTHLALVAASSFCAEARSSSEGSSSSRAAASSSEVKSLQKISIRSALTPIRTVETEKAPFGSGSITEIGSPERPEAAPERTPASQTQLQVLIQKNRRAIRSAQRKWLSGRPGRVGPPESIVINCSHTSPKALQSVLGSKVRVIDGWASDLGDLSSQTDSIVVVFDKTPPRTGRTPSSDEQNGTELPPICAHSEGAFVSVQFNANSNLIEQQPR